MQAFLEFDINLTIMLSAHLLSRTSCVWDLRDNYWVVWI